MSRTPLALGLLLSLAAAQDVVVEKLPKAVEKEGVVLETQLRRGQRFTGSNTVSYSMAITTRQGQNEVTESEAVERTERFIDEVRRADLNGTIEIERTYLKLFAKARTDDDSRPEIFQNALQGQKVELRERGRRRDLKLAGRGTIDPIVRRTAGMEIDWRDIFKEDPVRPGDAWEAEVGGLTRALAAYLNCGTRSKMRVRFEEIVENAGTRQAKLYVDWTIEGMRDRHLFTKVTVAGDVFFDMELKRVVAVDLVGNMIVRGAIIGSGPPMIVKGEGQVFVKSSLKVADIEAAPEEGEGEGEDQG